MSRGLAQSRGIVALCQVSSPAIHRAAAFRLSAYKNVQVGAPASPSQNRLLAAPVFDGRGPGPVRFSPTPTGLRHESGAFRPHSHDGPMLDSPHARAASLQTRFHRATAFSSPLLPHLSPCPCPAKSRPLAVRRQGFPHARRGGVFFGKLDVGIQQFTPRAQRRRSVPPP